MPRFDPFAGLRYSTDRVGLAEVIAPPYDVIGPAERDRLEARSPYNAIHVEAPRAEGDVYAAAGDRIAAWLSDGVLRTDPASLYAYEMAGVDEFGTARRTRGVFGALAIDGGGVLPHEHTTPKAKSDRLELLRATRVNTSPIWVLTPGPLSARLDGLGPPHEFVVDDDGIEHRLWLLDAEAAAAVAEVVAAEPVLVADGHHRYETALTYRAERRTEEGDGPGDHDLVFALVVELAPDELAVGAIHRLISGVAPAAVLDVLGRHFTLRPTEPVDRDIGTRMTDAGALAVISRQGAWLATPTPETETAATMDLDSSRLDVALAELAGASVVYQHGWRECGAAVETGDADVAVLLRPATVEQIAAVSRGGERMPPKTTFFWPKPRTGMVFRQLRGQA